MFRLFRKATMDDYPKTRDLLVQKIRLLDMFQDSVGGLLVKDFEERKVIHVNKNFLRYMNMETLKEGITGVELMQQFIHPDYLQYHQNSIEYLRNENSKRDVVTHLIRRASDKAVFRAVLIKVSVEGTPLKLIVGRYFPQDEEEILNEYRGLLYDKIQQVDDFVEAAQDPLDSVVKRSMSLSKIPEMAEVTRYVQQLEDLITDLRDSNKTPD